MSLNASQDLPQVAFDKAAAVLIWVGSWWARCWTAEENLLSRTAWNLWDSKSCCASSPWLWQTWARSTGQTQSSCLGLGLVSAPRTRVNCLFLLLRVAQVEVNLTKNLWWKHGGRNWFQINHPRCSVLWGVFIISFEYASQQSRCTFKIYPRFVNFHFQMSH